METTTQTIPQKPLEKLCLRKRELKSQSKAYKKSIAADFDFMQHHAGSFLMSGLSSVIFPKSHKGESNKNHTHKEADSSFNVMSLAKSLIIPTALSLAQPLLLSWGLGKVPTWIAGFLLRRLKKK